jgi:hypothetical protein
VKFRRTLNVIACRDCDRGRRADFDLDKSITIPRQLSWAVYSKTVWVPEILTSFFRNPQEQSRESEKTLRA